MIDVSGKRPCPSPVDMHTDETDGFYWQTDTNVKALRAVGFNAEERECHLPLALMRTMDGKRDGLAILPDQFNLWYPTEAEAVDALRSAVDRWQQ